MARINTTSVDSLSNNQQDFLRAYNYAQLRRVPVMAKENKYVPNNSFFDDVMDHYSLSWLNQWAESTSPIDQQVSDEYDPNYDVFADNFEPYLPYMKEFIGIKNKEQADFLKQKIDRNNARRDRLEQAGRILPGFAAAFLDPTTYIPIPMVGGLGFVKGAVRGGVGVGGITALTEPIRHNLDPTSTFEETTAMIGLSALAGGFIGGVAGSLTANLGSKTLKSALPKGTKKTLDDYDKELSENEGIKDYNQEEFYINPKKNFEDVTIKSKRGKQAREPEPIKDAIDAIEYLDPKGYKSLRIIDGYTGRHDKNGKYKKAFYQRKNNTIRIDREAIKRTFIDLPWTKPTVKGVKALPRDTFNNADEWADFVMLHEYSHSKIKQKPGQSIADYENAINRNAMEILGKIKKFNKGDAIRIKSVSGMKRFKALPGESVPQLRGRMQQQREIVDQTFTQTGVQQAIEETETAGVRSNVDDVVARYNNLTNEVELDIVKAKAQFEQKKHLEQLRQVGVTPPANLFRTADDWVNYTVRRAIFASEIMPKTLKEFKDMPVSEYLSTLNKRVIDDIVKDNVSKGAETSGIKYLRILEEVQNLGGVVNAVGRNVKNKKLRERVARDMLELLGDHGVMTKMNREGYSATPDSVLLRTFTQYQPKLRDAIFEMEDAYFGYHGIASDKTGGQRTIARGVLATQQFGSKVKNAFNKTKQGEVPPDVTLRDYYSMVGRYIMDEDVLQETQDIALQEAIKKGSIPFNRLMKEFNDVASSLQMFKSQKSFQIMTKRAELTLAKALDMQRTGKFTGEQAEALAKKIQSKREFLKLQQAEIDVVANDSLTAGKEKYFTRYFRHDKLVENADEFKAILRRHFETTLPQKITDPKYLKRRKLAEKRNKLTAKEKIPDDLTNREKILDAEVEYHYNQILEGHSRWGDIEGIHGYGIDVDGQYKVGARQLLQRELDIPNKELKDFIEQDAEIVMRQYVQRMAPALELHKKFGDVHLTEYLDNLELDLIADNVPQTARQKIINGFRDGKDNLLGTLYSDDPTTLSVQIANSIRNLASLAFMGKVTISALPEIARPLMVNGFHRTYKDVIGAYVGGLETIGKHSNINELDQLVPILEGELSSASSRFVFDSTAQQSKNFGGYFNKAVGQWLERPQQAFYQANILTPYTRGIKRIVRRMSMHRFVEDSAKLVAGKLDETGIARLASYGIDKNVAEVFSRMPIEKSKGTYYLNSMAWDALPGGKMARRKLQSAIYADMNRTIVTPSAADQVNMMHGVIRINDEGIAELMDNPLFKAMGFQKTDMGGKINNAWLGLLLQFYSWGISANRKVLIGLAQGRDGKMGQAMAGVSSAIALGMMADWAKNPRYYENKDLGEKIIRGVELSGTTALLGDANFMLETTSGGFFGESIGARPLLGLDQRFGDADGDDAVKEIIGSGPSMLFDVISAFSNDTLSDVEKKTMLRKLIPLNNFWLWDQAFRDLYNDVVIE